MLCARRCCFVLQDVAGGPLVAGNVTGRLRTACIFAERPFARVTGHRAGWRGRSAFMTDCERAPRVAETA